MGYEIKKYHGEYNRRKRVEAVKFIVVHYTGSGTSKPGSALANCKYFSGGNRNASANYFIDDTDVYEYADPGAYYCWHVGDGHGKYGITNSNSVGIEVCSGGEDFTEEEIKRLTWLVHQLMARFGVDADHVVRHYDASRKACPWPYVPNGADPTGLKWAKLHARITGDEGDDDEVTDADIQKIADKVWQYDVAGKGTQAQDRLYGTDVAANAAKNQVTRTDDPTGRNQHLNDHDHIKWLAAKQAEMDKKLDDILDALKK